MKERDLRRRCKQELRALDIRPPLRVEELCARSGQRRGRPIQLIEYPLVVPGPFGLWLATETSDYIVYQAETSRAHQAHIILHELGHIWGDHVSDEDDEEYWANTMPGLSPELIRRALRRTCYDAANELEAETVATVIMEWAAQLAGSPTQAIDCSEPHTDGRALQRLETALTDHQGWM